MRTLVSNQKAFTLIEVMISLAVAGIVAAAMYGFQQGQLKTYVTQETIVNMHQNARAAMHYMVSEIRMAGCDPTRAVDAGITNATATSISFTMDFAGNGTLNYNFDGGTIAGPSGGPEPDWDYVMQRADGDLDDNGEAITYTLSGLDLIRTDTNSGNPGQVVARNFDALNFDYFDQNGNALPVPVPSDRLEDITSVVVSLVARSGESVPGFMRSQADTQVYTTKTGFSFGPANDNFRRILLSNEIRLRNAGLS